MLVSKVSNLHTAIFFANLVLVGTHIGRVKVLFRLPQHLKLIGSYKTQAPGIWPKSVLAYIEWFTVPSLSSGEQTTHNMVTVRKSALLSDSAPPWSIIPVSNIRQSCMLTPNLQKTSFRTSWTSSNILDSADTFLVNNWTSVYTYKTIYKE